MWRFLILLLFTTSLAYGQTAPNAVGFSTVVVKESLPSLVVMDASHLFLASQTGLQPGDVILAADGRLVTSEDDIRQGEICRIGGMLMRLDVYRPVQNDFSEGNIFSKGVCPIIETRVMFVSRPVLKVADVVPQSTAWHYGMQPGDILLTAGGKLLGGPPQALGAKGDQLATLIATTPDFALLFSRGGRIYEQKFHVASATGSGNAAAEMQTPAPPSMLSSSSQEAIAPSPAPTVNSQVPQPPSNPIIFIQEFLRSKERTPTLPVSGNWDAQTSEGVRGFLTFIQSRSMWGHPWNGPRDGIYSDAYAVYLRQAIRATQEDGRIDQVDVVQLESFAKALDDLKAQGVYKEPQPVSTNAATDVAPSAPAQSHADAPFLFPAFLWFANGALSGFGDEMWCGLMHAPQTFSQCHADARTQLDQLMASDHLFALGANFAGVAANPISWILIGLAVWSEVSVLFAVLLAMLFGVADCVLYTLGDLFTWGFHDLDYPQILANAVISALIFLLVVAKHRWDDGKKWHDADRHRHRWS